MQLRKAKPALQYHFRSPFNVSSSTHSSFKIFSFTQIPAHSNMRAHSKWLPRWRQLCVASKTRRYRRKNETRLGMYLHALRDWTRLNNLLCPNRRGFLWGSGCIFHLDQLRTEMLEAHLLHHRQWRSRARHHSNVLVTFCTRALALKARRICGLSSSMMSCYNVNARELHPYLWYQPQTHALILYLTFKERQSMRPLADVPNLATSISL